MKQICLNCTHFECCDEYGEFLEKGFCGIDPLLKDVEDDDTCSQYKANPQREEDLKNGM